MNFFNKIIAGILPIVPKPIVRKVSSRYIAGATINDAVSTVRKLNSEGAMATVDVLGEYIKVIGEATENTRYSVEVLEAVHKNSIDSNLSIKLTSLGLGIDPAACEKNVRLILDAARTNGNNFVRIDMEDSHYTTATLDLYDKLRKEYSNVGVVLQAYLKRTESDIKRLMDGGPTNFRLCKGIYIEPEEIAFKDRQEIRNNYLKCLDLLFSGGSYVGIATHDDYLTSNAEQIIKRHNLRRGQYEFQMLLGVREQLRRSLISNGHRLRVYVPFGADWYGYSVRRLKENPSVAGYIVKAMFGGGK
ncbi:MAG TPA: proline dehydrogenase family protein [Candidatus Kapabacteria bacterium]|nr:proline dehydrogenase family protein [Candidatus Kapabacteria bacterium]